MKCFQFLLLLLFSAPVFAQLGFCEGSKGDPIFHESFGNGSGTGPALPPGLTSYSYVKGDPVDGQYTISDRVGQDNFTWHSPFPSTTISRGRALVVNASFTSGQFYRTEIDNLCQNTTYEFSAFLMNIYNRSHTVCENGGIPINVRFEIWDQTETMILKAGSTGSLASTSTPQWKQFALTFQSKAGQESVILKMYNNGEGGCGNDLAIDDIIFRSCGDLTEVTDVNTKSSGIQACQEEVPIDLSLQAQSDSSVYSEAYYQWQQSSDAENWMDISGETGNFYNAQGITSSTYYRVKVAENPANLQDNLCSSASKAFVVNVARTPLAPVSLGDVETCSDELHPGLRVQTASGESIDWYDAPTGGNRIAENSNPFFPEHPGTYYAEARKTGFICTPGPRTAVGFLVNQAPEVEDELVYLCHESFVTLDAGLNNVAYSWNTGATSRTLDVSGGGVFSVEISTPQGCSSTKTFEVIPVELPEIKELISDGPAVTIVLEEAGDFEFSLDGVHFQQDGLFPSVDGGVYTAYVKDMAGCRVVTKEFAHLVLPLFITPNNDGYHDFLELKGISFFGRSEVMVFDRYGKVLAAGAGEDFKWDGKAGGKDLPSDEYWYFITIEGFEPIKGHFTLIR